MIEEAVASRHQSYEVLDVELPGPSESIALQTLRWLTQPPLQWMSALGRHYGETFRLRVYGPSYHTDRTWRPMIPRTVVMLSAPDHLREVFARSRDELSAGEAQQFLAWHIGNDCVVVLDGEAHRLERHQLGSVFRPASYAAWDDLTREAVRRALHAWPQSGTIDLVPAVRRVGTEAMITSMFGALPSQEVDNLASWIHRGASASSLSPAMLTLPFWRADLGPWSPGGRVRRATQAFDEFVARELQRVGQGETRLTMLRLLAELRRPDAGNEAARVMQRVRTMLGAWHTVTVAAVWCCLHVLNDSDTTARVREAADGDTDSSREYLDAVARESLRLNPPFLGAFRFVRSPVTIGGIRLRAGTVVFPNSYLTHRRPSLFPDPERFRPERFLERSFAPHEFAPFGGGIRRCLGDHLAIRQVGLICAEVLRAFDVRPIRPWQREEKRVETVLLPRYPLFATVQRR